MLAVQSANGGGVLSPVVEHVGEATWQASLHSLARAGRLVTCGATTGPKAECDLNLIFFKGLSILGSTMGSKGDVPLLIDLLAAGKLRPVIGATLPMQDVRKAHEMLEARSVFGKVVLTCDT